MRAAGVDIRPCLCCKAQTSEADLDWRRLEVGFTAACKMRGRSDLA